MPATILAFPTARHAPADVAGEPSDLPVCQAIVEAEPLPGYAATTAYRIHGPTIGEVQRAIDALMGGPDVVASQFRTPQRNRSPECAGRWCSLGFVQRGLGSNAPGA